MPVRARAPHDIPEVPVLSFLGAAGTVTGSRFLLDTPEGRGTMEFEAKVQTIALALCEPAPPHAPVAASADELRGLLFADEVAALFELYIDFVTKRSPISAAKSAEEVASLVDS